MSTNRLNHGLTMCVSLMLMLEASPVAFGQVCPCETDLIGQGAGGLRCDVLDGVISVQDILFIIQCIGNQADLTCGRPLSACDVNCDGLVDFTDFDAVNAAFNGAPSPCDGPIGACCVANTDFPGCVEVSNSTCTGFVFGGTYAGDGTTCNPSPCDCNNNGVDDGTDIANLTSDDCNANGVPDECEPGRCCFLATDSRTNITTQACSQERRDVCLGAPINGTWGGACSKCPQQNVAIIEEGDGSIFVHVIGPPVDCNGGGAVAGAAATAGCTGGPFTDAWVSATGGTMCHNFGVVGSPAIPADFFGSGSDPFTGTVCLQGVPLAAGGQFGDADTMILRTADPFGRCDPPPATPSTVDIEIVALSLQSVSPITVTFNGGQNPEMWDAFVDLSPGGLLAGTPQSTLTAIKTGFNGGTYTSDMFVQPRFTFTNAGSPDSPAVLDTNVANIPAVELAQTTPKPWVVEVAAELGLSGDVCSAFHPGVESTAFFPAVDCNANGAFDDCDIASGASLDANGNGVPDECEVLPLIPAASSWGLAAMTMLLCVAATLLLRRRMQLRPV